MHALTLARQRLRAHLQSPSTPRPVRLAHGLVEEGRGQFLPILSSPLAQDILSRGYDARTLERVYQNQPSGELGLVGRMADRVILDLPVHQALRERHAAAVGEMAAAATLAVRAGENRFRVLSAPCGLGAELCELAARLQARRPEVMERLLAWGVDPDREGELLPEARRRAREAGLKARFLREDLRRHREVADVARAEGRFHLASCVGLTQLFPTPDLAALLRFYSGLLAPGGTLLLDRWEPAGSCRITEGLGICLRSHTGRELRELLAESGLSVEREHPTGEGGCVLAVARKTGA